jgi:hypothetical protein
MTGLGRIGGAEILPYATACDTYLANGSAALLLSQEKRPQNAG